MPSPIAVQTLIKSSLRLIGAVASGENPTPEEMDDALLVLNDMLENWSTETLSVWGSADQTFNLVPGQSVYTIGVGGNFNATRPVYIDDSFMTFSGIDTPVLSISQQEYNGINLKTMQQPVVERMLYVNDFPLGQITLWPVPNSTSTITLSCSRVLASGVVSTDTLAGPPGYLKALRYCLAVELAPEFGVEASQTVVAVAADAKGDYKKSNMVDVVARYDDALTDNFDDSVGWRY